jgi:hypothetical protein
VRRAVGTLREAVPVSECSDGTEMDEWSYTLNRDHKICVTRIQGGIGVSRSDRSRRSGITSESPTNRQLCSLVGEVSPAEAPQTKGAKIGRER